MYSFQGGSLSPEIRTFVVYPVENQATIVNPSLAPDLEEALREYLLRETNLTESLTNPDLSYRVTITDYVVRPLTVGTDQAQTNRLTISARVQFHNAIESQYDIDRTFTAYADIEASQALSDVEDQLVGELIRRLVEDIYNATINAW